MASITRLTTFRDYYAINKELLAGLTNQMDSTAQTKLIKQANAKKISADTSISSKMCIRDRYMGADEYEILAFDDKRVVLHDMQYPLFQKELERDEFDRRVRENPMNDHLKVMNQAAVAEQQPRFNSIEFEKLIPHHMRFKETDLVNGNEMYWVTQEIFTAGDLRKFQQAVQSYDGDIKKFYVTPVSYTHLDVYKRQAIPL